MFFSRLRRHAKWMFVFLAIVFGVGFVGFGIGANQNASIGDLLRGGGGTTNGSISVSDARDAVQKNPKSAEAQRSLSTALQEDGQTDEALVVLNRYLDLRPKDKEALQELAGLHLSRANAQARTAQEAQLRASYLTFGTTFSSPARPRQGRDARPRPDRRGDFDRGERGCQHGVHGRPGVLPAGGGCVRPARRRRPAGPEHPARAGTSGAAERRRCEGDRGLREVPEAGSRRPDCADRQAADRAAEGRTEPGPVGLDSPATGKTPHILSARPGALDELRRQD